MPTAGHRNSLLRWINALSVDAVAVGMIWQAVFSKGFRGVWPTAVESATLAMTLWLIYTADHLLDATRLDLSRPHTFRHRVHQTHRNRLVIVWVLMTVMDTAAIILVLSDSLIRAGLGLAAAVLIYGASVQFQPDRQPWVAKEVKVGVIFAFGVGLLVWAQSPSFTLMAATGLASVLFACNCVLVGHWESEADRHQSFPSLSCRSPRSAPITPWVLAILCIVTSLTAMTDILPRLVTASIAISALMLVFASSWLRTKPAEVVDESNGFGPIPGLIADAVLLSPVLIWWLI